VGGPAGVRENRGAGAAWVTPSSSIRVLRTYWYSCVPSSSSVSRAKKSREGGRITIVTWGAMVPRCEAAAEGEVCTVANDNDPSQVVISGHRGAIERALEIAKEKGAKRAILLPVSAPFHCPLMKPAAEAMAEALAGVRMEPPAVSLYANVTAAPVDSPDTIRELLVEQVTGMVRWRESVLAMQEAGVADFVELGGKVLGGMVKRIAPDAGALQQGRVRGDAVDHRMRQTGTQLRQIGTVEIEVKCLAH